jgi:hypothetical protein
MLLFYLSKNPLLTLGKMAAAPIWRMSVAKQKKCFFSLYTLSSAPALEKTPTEGKF